MERIIFVLSYEKKWNCWVVYANRAIDAGDFFQSTGRYLGEEPAGISVVQELVNIILKYDTPALYKQFGRKRYKDERDFLLKVEEEYIREEIRPYIEKKVVQVIDRLAGMGYPLFLKNSRLDNFYKQQRIVLQTVPLRALLRFERTGEYTRYILRLVADGHLFYPSDYDLKILSRRPCRILSGHRLFCFADDFDGHRLQPFLQKREVMIPKANEQVYFQKFILKNIRHEEIEVQGFEVIVREEEKRAILSLECEIIAMPVLVFGFYYGRQYIPAWSERKALVELCTEGEHYAFYKVNRDFAWEEKQEKELLSFGLVVRSPGCFGIKGIYEPLRQRQKGDAEQKKPDAKQIEEAWALTVDWIQKHQAELQRLGIDFSQKRLQKSYYIAGWHVEFALHEATDWFELKAEVVLADGRRLPLICFREHILSGQREYMLEDGSVFMIPSEWFATYTEILLFASGKGASLFLRKNQYTLLEKIQEEQAICSGERAEAIDLPRDLKAILRPYQQLGYEWLYRLYRNGRGGCLADDMGLGKTLQVITLLLKYRQETVKRMSIRKFPVTGTQLSLFTTEHQEINSVEDGSPGYHTCLIVVPASLVHNWRNELHKFAPQLTITLYAGQNRDELRAYLQRSDVVITTYHTLRNDIDYLARLSFGIVVADEAQMIKNPASQLHQAILRIQGVWFYALSGTPVENSLTDLWAIMNLVNRNVLGSYYFFRKHFIKPILVDIEGRMKITLQKLIAPYVLRRTKEEVLSELPELTSEVVICEPEEEQKKIYQEEQSKVRNYILEKSDTQEGLRTDFMVLKALIRLRQIANHPRLIDPEYLGGSGKFREIFRMLKEVIGAGHKVLVFSSFVRYLKMVSEEAVVLGCKQAMLTGATADREQEIRRFTQDTKCQLFLISLKAGGVGLNLTEADYVFILDPWWNLAAENQAIGRAHRMGQKQAVFVYRFITADTLEQKILAIQQRKQQLAEAVITTSTTVPLTDKELLEALG